MRGNLLSFEKKKEEKTGTWNLGGSSVLAGNKGSTISWTSMNIYINMGINKNYTYLNLSNCAQGLHLALYIGLYALPARLVQKEVAGGPGNRILWIKLAKMLNVPRVAH